MKLLYKSQIFNSLATLKCIFIKLFSSSKALCSTIVPAVPLYKAWGAIWTAWRNTNYRSSDCRYCYSCCGGNSAEENKMNTCTRWWVCVYLLICIVSMTSMSLHQLFQGASMCLLFHTSLFCPNFLYFSCLFKNSITHSPSFKIPYNSQHTGVDSTIM